MGQSNSRFNSLAVVDEPKSKGTEYILSLTDQRMKVKANASRSSCALINADTGAMLLCASAKQSGCFGRITTIVVVDHAGNEIGTAIGKDHGMRYSYSVYVATPSYDGQLAELKVTASNGSPVYEFARGDIKVGFGTASGTYHVVESESVLRPVYAYKKWRSLGFKLSVDRVSAADGATAVAKLAQTGLDPKKVGGEVGAGVDLAAVALISAFVGCATNSNGGANAGALAGAGVI